MRYHPDEDTIVHLREAIDDVVQKLKSLEEVEQAKQLERELDQQHKAKLYILDIVFVTLASQIY